MLVYLREYLPGFVGRISIEIFLNLKTSPFVLVYVRWSPRVPFKSQGEKYCIRYREAQRYTKGTGSLLYSSDYLAQTVGVGRGPGIRVLSPQPTQHIFRFSTLVQIHKFMYLAICWRR